MFRSVAQMLQRSGPLACTQAWLDRHILLQTEGSGRLTHGRDDIRRLDQAMQSAALDPLQWERALNSLSGFVESDGAILLSVQARQKFTPCSTDLTEMTHDYFDRSWHSRDLREACLPLLKARGIVFDHDFQSIDDIGQGEYFNDFIFRHRRKWFAGVHASVDGDDWCLALQRKPETGPFTKRDLAKLNIVRGLLGNAAGLAASLGRSWVAGLYDTLHIMAQPAAIFDNRAQVLEVNALAMAVLGSYIGKDRKLNFNNVRTTSALEAILTKASCLGEYKSGSVACIIQIGSKNYSFRAISLAYNKHLIASCAAVLVTFQAAPESLDLLLRRKFGLTDAEVRVAMAISKGGNVRQIAEAHRIKEDTVRTQLKSVYQKTSVCSQSQLVAFVRDLLST